MTLASGARPTKGKNLAIAKWPTMADGHEGWADYALFAGLRRVGVVEAKRKQEDVMGVIARSKRYAVGYLTKGRPTTPAARGPVHARGPARAARASRRPAGPDEPAEAMLARVRSVAGGAPTNAKPKRGRKPAARERGGGG